MSVYIKLFHGRTDPNETMDDWGEEGPCLGPVPYAHGTYATDIKFGYDRNQNFLALQYIEDCLYYDGVYYGDFSITSAPTKGEAAVPLDPIKAKPPPRTIVPQKF